MGYVEGEPKTKAGRRKIVLFECGSCMGIREIYKKRSTCTWIGYTGCFSCLEGLEVLQLRSILSVAGKRDAGSPLPRANQTSLFVPDMGLPVWLRHLLLPRRLSVLLVAHRPARYFHVAVQSRCL